MEKADRIIIAVIIDAFKAFLKAELFKVDPIEFARINATPIPNSNHCLCLPINNSIFKERIFLRSCEILCLFYSGFMLIKVLIVDDSVIMRKSLKDLFEKFQGISIVGEASDGNEAIQLCNEMKPDLVTMDITMPNVNGLTAIHQIKKLEEIQETKIVVISSNDQRKMVFQALNLGVENYLIKPFSDENFKENIEDALGCKLQYALN